MTRLPSGEKRMRSSPEPAFRRQTPRIAAARPERSTDAASGVRFEVDIDRAERDPFAIGRNDRLADALELHHVFEGEGTLGLGESGKRTADRNRKRNKTT